MTEAFRLRKLSRLGWLAMALILCLSDESLLLGQERPLDVSSLGFQIPPGIVRQAEGQRVLTNDEEGKPVVALVHVFVGPNPIVMLPDGRLVARTAVNAPLTDRPFKALTLEQMAKRMSARFPRFRVKKTRRYVYVYNTSEAFALATSRILETMFPGVTSHSKAQKIATHEPKVPLVAIMFRTEAEYQKYKRMPPGAIAYYSTLSNQVVMFEESKLIKVKPRVGIQQKISTIAHEGVHQILHNIGVQKRLSVWPMWLSEGMAEYFAPTSTGRRLRWKGPGQVNDLRMFELEQYVKSNSGRPADGKMVRDTVRARRLTSTGYASAWALTHLLAKTKRADFNRYVHEVAKIMPLEGGRRPAGGTLNPLQNLPLFQKHFGDDFAKLETALVQHLKKLPYRDPFADSPHYLGMVTARNGRRSQREANVFYSTQLAQQWIEQTLARIPAAQRAAARFQVRRFPNRASADKAAVQWLRSGN